MEKPSKTAFQFSIIDFYFVTLFYCLYYICILSSGGVRYSECVYFSRNILSELAGISTTAPPFDVVIKVSVG